MTSTMGERIKSARLRKGLTQVELAKRIKASSHTLICDYERGKRGKRRPDIQMLIKIASILDVSIDYLLLGKTNNNK